MRNPNLLCSCGHVARQHYTDWVIPGYGCALPGCPCRDFQQEPVQLEVQPKPEPPTLPVHLL